jgi:hypothetical protein
MVVNQSVKVGLKVDKGMHDKRFVLLPGWQKEMGYDDRSIQGSWVAVKKGPERVGLANCMVLRAVARIASLSFDGLLFFPQLICTKSNSNPLEGGNKSTDFTTTSSFLFYISAVIGTKV